MDYMKIMQWAENNFSCPAISPAIFSAIFGSVSVSHSVADQPSLKVF